MSADADADADASGVCASALAEFFDNLEQWNIIVLPTIGGVLLLTLVLSIISRMRDKYAAQFSQPFMVGLALVDFGTDAVFVIAVLQTEISSCRDDMIAQALPIIVPAVFAFVFLLNGTVACWIFITELKNNLRFIQWFRRSAPVAGLVLLLSCSNLDALRLLRSKVFGLKVFDAPFTLKTTNRMLWLGLVGVVFEDIPQLLLQLFIYIYLRPQFGVGETSLLLWISIIASGLSVIFGLVTRILLCYAIRRGEYYDEANESIFGSGYWGAFLFNWDRCWWGRVMDRSGVPESVTTIKMSDFVPEVTIFNSEDTNTTKKSKRKKSVSWSRSGDTTRRSKS